MRKSLSIILTLAVLAGPAIADPGKVKPAGIPQAETTFAPFFTDRAADKNKGKSKVGEVIVHAEAETISSDPATPIDERYTGRARVYDCILHGSPHSGKTKI